MTTVAQPIPTAAVPPLSQLLREGSRVEHQAAESSGFVTALLDGGIGAAGYLAYLRRLALVYDALEAAAERLASHPIAGVVVDRALYRGSLLGADLAYWTSRAGDPPPSDSPAAMAYVARIEEAVREWPGLYIAHHYTRYLGDLSGGQAIGRSLVRNYELQAPMGVAFYEFARIRKPKPYKDAYRSRLDALPLVDADKHRLLDEVRVAFALNGALFGELGQRMDEYCRA
jgi:heme oxygenase (biliverdin-producing, ferredoxin)